MHGKPGSTLCPLSSAGAKGKRTQVAITAVARELAAFIWASPVPWRWCYERHIDAVSVPGMEDAPRWRILGVTWIRQLAELPGPSERQLTTECKHAVNTREYQHDLPSHRAPFLHDRKNHMLQQIRAGQLRAASCTSHGWTHSRRALVAWFTGKYVENVQGQKYSCNRHPYQYITRKFSPGGQ